VYIKLYNSDFACEFLVSKVAIFNHGVIFRIIKKIQVLTIKGDVNAGKPIGLRSESIPAVIGTVIAAANIP
jgi:hypothetical protein